MRITHSHAPWSPEADLIVRDYLERLRRRLAGLPRADQEEFLLEIRSHIHEAFVEAQGSGPLASPAETGRDVERDVERILRILDRLGEPAQVLAQRVGPGLIRNGLLRKLPFYVGAGVLLLFAGLPLGFMGTALLLSIASTLLFAVFIYYGTAVALTALGLLGLITTLFKLTVPGFVVDMSAVWGLRSPHLDHLTGRLLFSFLLLGVGASLLWIGRHGPRGARLLLRAAVRRFQAFRQGRRSRAWALIAVLLLFLPAATHGAPLLDPQDMDPTVRPGDDLFRYANGAWIDRLDLPPDRAVYRMKEIVEEARDAEIRELLDHILADHDAAPGSDRQRIRDFLRSGLDSLAIARDGLRHLQPELDRIAAMETAADLQAAITDLHRQMIWPLFAAMAAPDMKNSSLHGFYIHQDGLGLSDRDDYTADGEPAASIRAEYLRHVTRMLELMGEPADEAAADARSIMAVETRLAHTFLTQTQRRDLALQYNPTDRAGLADLCPGFDWPRYFDTIGVQPDTVVVTNPEHLREVGRMLQELPMRDWRAYLRWKLLDRYAEYLSPPFVDQNWRFYSAFLQGEQVMRSHADRVRETVDASLGEILGRAYVAAHFPPENKARLEEMFRQLKAVMARRIEANDWMGAATKTAALAKLEAMRLKVGYPDRWLEDAALDLRPDAYLMNIRRVMVFRYQRALSRWGRPVDLELWAMPPQVANAGYNPQKNEVCFPAGILRPPVFYPAGDEAVNYGSIGYAMGHEMTHGFDDLGRRFDAQGNLHNWWTPEDEAEFRRRAQILVDQYDAFVAVDTLHVNGRMTLGENIADVGGLTLALDAYHAALGGRTPEPIDGLTGDQRFFLAFAKYYRGKARDQALRRMVVEDRHPWGLFRVNGAPPHVAGFYDAFAVRPGDRLYRQPEERVEIW